MKSQTGTCKYLAFRLLVAILAASAMGVPANAGHQSQGEGSGKEVIHIVTVPPPASGITIRSGSTISTMKGRSVLVNLGKLGHVEVSRDSRIQINYSDNFIIAPLYVGRVRISIPAGVSVNISTTDGEVISDGVKASFMVDITCGNTVVTVKTGHVELRADSEAEGKKIAEGATDSIGKPCTRKNAH
jgi:ferric-dicitrate binding protein FerR (iron transport regulator)